MIINNFLKTTQSLSLMCVTVLLSHVLMANAHANQHDDFLKSIVSAKDTKKRIIRLLDQRDNCHVGSCWNNISTQICTHIAGIDIKTGYKLSNDMTGITPDFTLSTADTSLFKLMYQQCKPSSYQYWGYDHLLHVLYSPSPKDEATINKLLKR